MSGVGLLIQKKERSLYLHLSFEELPQHRWKNSQTRLMQRDNMIDTCRHEIMFPKESRETKEQGLFFILCTQRFVIPLSIVKLSIIDIHKIVCTPTC